MSDIDHTRDCVLPSDGKAEGLVRASELLALSAERDALRAEVERLTAQLVEAEKYNGWHQQACLENQKLRAALEEGRIEAYYARQIEWSRQTFGPALRTKGVIDHITKELREIASDPHDLSEWVDVIILAMDGFWRHGGKPEDLMPALLAKQAKNMARKWPDWRTMSEDGAIEHDRSGEARALLTPAPSTGEPKDE